MSSTLRFRFQAWLEDVNGNVQRNGAIDTPVSLSISGIVLDVSKAIGTSTTWSAWDSSAQPSDFNFLVIVSDLDDVMVELTTDYGNEIGTKLATFQLKAGMPLIVPSNVSYANYSANFAGGTLDVIDKIRIRNVSSTTTANVRLWLAT